MPANYVYVVFGYRIPQDDYIRALGYTELESDISSVTELVTGKEGAYLNQQHEVDEDLTAMVVAHDDDDMEPIILGMLVSTIRVGRGPCKTHLGSHAIDVERLNSLSQQLQCIIARHVEYATNPNLCALLRAMTPALHIVKDECACCN